MRDYPPEYDLPVGCEVCRRDVDDCDCPECPECGAVGDPRCYQTDLQPWCDSIASFCEHIGIGPLSQALRAIGKYNTESIHLILHDGTMISEGNHEFDSTPWVRVKEAVVSGIAWDGSDWEWSGKVPGGDWAGLDTLREAFDDALEEYRAERDAEGL